MKEIRFDISDTERGKQIKVGHMRQMQAGNAGLDTIVQVMANFMVDKDGAFIDAQVALNTLDDLTVGQLEAVADQFREAVTELAPPKEKGNS